METKTMTHTTRCVELRAQLRRAEHETERARRYRDEIAEYDPPLTVVDLTVYDQACREVEAAEASEARIRTQVIRCHVGDHPECHVP